MRLKRSQKMSAPRITSWIAIGICFALLCVMTGVYGIYRWSVSQESSVSQKVQLQDTPSQIYTTKSEEIHTVESRHLYTGNVFWGRYMDDWSHQYATSQTSVKPTSLEDKRDFNFPFSQVSTFNRESYQAVVGGLECPITSEYRTSAKQEKALQFSCLPQYVPFARTFFDAFSLANNHTDNMEQIDGFENTRMVLEEESIQYFGHYDNAQTEDICEIVAFPVVINKDTSKTRPFPFALCGYHNVFKLPTKQELQKITEFSTYFPTIVMPHQGAEYKTKGDTIQTNTFRSMVDYGADAVLSDHPHYAQNMEVYKNVLIAHSMGNFLFDQQFNYEVTHAMAIDALFSFDSDTVEPYLSLQEKFSCHTFKDTCLQQAAMLKLKKPQFTITYSIIPVDSSSQIPKRGNSDVLDFLHTRANWNQIPSSLKQ